MGIEKGGIEDLWNSKQMDHFPMFIAPILWVFIDTNTDTLTKNSRPKPIPIP